jgi:hypothetical protein
MSEDDDDLSWRALLYPPLEQEPRTTKEYTDLALRMRFKDTPIRWDDELAIVFPESYAFYLAKRIEGKNYLELVNDPVISEVVRIVTELQRLVVSAGYRLKEREPHGN